MNTDAPEVSTATMTDRPVIDPPMSRRAWVALVTIVRKEIVRFMRIWTQTLIPPAITMTLYFLIFGTLIGSRIGKESGFDYMQFIVPGLIMMAVINNAYANVVSSFFGAKFQGHIEEILVSPTPNYVIVIGYVAGGVTRALLVGLVVSGVSLFFTRLTIHNPWITAAAIFLTAVLFSIGGLLNALFARKFDDISIIPNFVLTPLIYLGGVFYAINKLPDWAQYLSRANPILYMVNAFRYGILGNEPDVPIPLAFGMILFFVAGLFWLALYLLNRGVGVRS